MCYDTLIDLCLNSAFEIYDDHRTCVRLHGWKQPSVSVGYSKRRLDLVPFRPRYFPVSTHSLSHQRGGSTSLFHNPQLLNCLGVRVFAYKGAR